MSTNDNTFSRQWGLIRLLGGSAEGLGLAEIAEKTGLNRRTIQRHFALFRENGLPLLETKDDSGRKLYLIALHDPKTAFTIDELIAVYMARHFLGPMMGTFLWDAMQQALGKMRRNLGSQMIRYLERNIGKFGKTQFGWSDYENRAGMIDDLVAAIEDRQRAVILYRSLKDEAATPVTVSPYGLIHHDGSLYLVGYSHKREGIRHWKVDRMYGVAVTGDTFEPPTGFELSLHLSNGERNKRPPSPMAMDLTPPNPQPNRPPKRRPPRNRPDRKQPHPMNSQSPRTQRRL